MCVFTIRSLSLLMKIQSQTLVESWSLGFSLIWDFSVWWAPPPSLPPLSPPKAAVAQGGAGAPPPRTLGGRPLPPSQAPRRAAHKIFANINKYLQLLTKSSWIFAVWDKNTPFLKKGMSFLQTKNGCGRLFSRKWDLETPILTKC